MTSLCETYWCNLSEYTRQGRLNHMMSICDMCIEEDEFIGWGNDDHETLSMSTVHMSCTC